MGSGLGGASLRRRHRAARRPAGDPGAGADLRPLLEAAATRTYETPQGRRVRPRTLEAWYYAHKHGGIEALEPATRKDTGTCRALPEPLAQHILVLRREQPRSSVRTLVRAVERAGICRVGETSASSSTRTGEAHHLRACRSFGRRRRLGAAPRLARF